MSARPDWEAYGPTWHRTAARCAGCGALSHTPGLFGWRWHRDGSGFLLSRCRRCLPFTAGKTADGAFGLTSSQRGALRGAAGRNRQRASEGDADA